jgi:hypothetical protein
LNFMCGIVFSFFRFWVFIKFGHFWFWCFHFVVLVLEIDLCWFIKKVISEINFCCFCFYTQIYFII